MKGGVTLERDGEGEREAEARVGDSGKEAGREYSSY